MHTFSESGTGTGVPAFLGKLWRLVEDPKTNDLICWNKDGRSFIIQNQAQFARDLLPLNYKHNNMASFIRQLNMYGFHKITSIENGGLKFDRDDIEFSHPCFKRNCPYLLVHIKRKIAHTKNVDEKTIVKPEAVSKVLQDVKVMRSRQDSLDASFTSMKLENEALWREIAALRQKHAKQQQIVNKLIQFLISFVQPTRMTGVRRHRPLMINYPPDNARLLTTSGPDSDYGPVIQELGEELLDEVADEPDFDLIESVSPSSSVHMFQHDPKTPSPLIERPQSSNSAMSMNYDYSNQSADDALLQMGIGGDGDGDGGHASEVIEASDNSVDLTSGVVNSLNPKMIYDVTASSDVHANNGGVMPPDDRRVLPVSNIVATVNENARTRTGQLKQKNRRRRKNTSNKTTQRYIVKNIKTEIDDEIGGDGGRSDDVSAPAAKLQRRNAMTDFNAATLSSSVSAQEMKPDVGSIDPLLFLNLCKNNDNEKATKPSILFSRNDGEKEGNENSNQSAIKSNATATTTTINGSGNILRKSPCNLYNNNNNNSNNNNNNGDDDEDNDNGDGNDFMASGITTDIFDESPFPSLTSPPSMQLQQQQQQEIVKTNRSSDIDLEGKFSPYIFSNDSKKAADVASTSTGANNMLMIPSSSSVKNLALTKYRNDRNHPNGGVGGGGGGGGGGGNGNSSIGGGGEYMRLSTEEDVHGHLDNMQDELDSLKDLLRSDGYSLDANTLLGLFSDSDILGPYGLLLPAENSMERKGSELMTYQPMLDLSELMELNDKEDGSTNVTISGALQDAGSANSNLNTPCHN